MRRNQSMGYWLPAVVIAVCLHIILLIQLASVLRNEPAENGQTDISFETMQGREAAPIKSSDLAVAATKEAAPVVRKDDHVIQKSVTDASPIDAVPPTGVSHVDKAANSQPTKTQAAIAAIAPETPLTRSRPLVPVQDSEPLRHVPRKVQDVVAVPQRSSRAKSAGATALETATSQPVKTDMKETKPVAVKAIASPLAPPSRQNAQGTVSPRKHSGFPLRNQPETTQLAAIESREQKAIVAAPAPSPVPNPVSAGRAADPFQQAISFLASQPQMPCTFVMPKRLPRGKLGLLGIGNNGDHVEAIIDAFHDALGSPAAAQFAPITKSQCEAISFAQSNGIPVNLSLGIELDKAVIKDGASLRGSVWGRSGRIHLLLVDDEGLVQKMDGLLRPSKSPETRRADQAKWLSFATPLTITGVPVVTAQLLVAISSSEPLASLDRFNGIEASSFFEQVRREMESRDLVLDMAFTAFVVKP